MTTDPLRIFADKQIIDNRYEISRAIGRGGQGEVYLAHDSDLHRDVVIKAMRIPHDTSEAPDVMQKRFEVEAKLAGTLTHPNIVAVYAYAQYSHDSWYYVMEYVHDSQELGVFLNSYTEKQELLPLSLVLSLMTQLGAALDAIHNHGAIHRDIKLANMLLFETLEGYRLKLLDFGIAAVPNMHLTKTGLFVGTPTYTAPEQYLGAASRKDGITIDHRIDIWALGVCFYKLLTQVFPFNAQDFDEIIRKKPQVPSALRSDIPPGIDYIIMRCLEKHPDERFASAKEVVQAIKSYESMPVYESNYQTTVSKRNKKLRDVSLEGLDHGKKLLSAFNLDKCHKADASNPFGAKADDERLQHTMDEPQTFVLLDPVASDDDHEPLYVPYHDDEDHMTGTKPVPPALLVLKRAAVAVGVVSVLVLFVAVMSGDDASHAAMQEPLVTHDVTMPQKPVTPQMLLDDERYASRKKLMHGVRAGNTAQGQDGFMDSSDKGTNRATLASKRAKPKHVTNMSTTTPRVTHSVVTTTAQTATTAPHNQQRRIKRNPTSLIQYFGEDTTKKEKNTLLGITIGMQTKARLQTTLHSDHPQTLVIATIIDGFTLNKESKLKGATIIGHAHYSHHGNNGIISLTFTTLTETTGNKHTILMHAITASGTAGIPVNLIHTKKRAASNAALTALDVAQAVAGTTINTITGRVANDVRQDAAGLRSEQVSMSLPKNSLITIQNLKDL